MKAWLLIACLIALPASAEVFMYIDAQGNRVFTDQPKPGDARRVPLATTNRMAANPASAAPLLAQSSPEVQALLHYEVLRK